MHDDQNYRQFNFISVYNVNSNCNANMNVNDGQLYLILHVRKELGSLTYYRRP